jgi:thiol-disulfide isomerase/thioredoxin
VQVGPLFFPLALLVALASIGAFVLAADRIARKAGVDLENSQWCTVLVGFAVARLAFVFEYRALYFSSPLTIFDIRDGGWNAAVGLVAAWLYVLNRQRRDPTTAKPLRWGLTAGTALFFAGLLILAVRQDTGERLPDLAFSSLDGEPVKLSEFTGKPTVVNLWATWCPPCAREMPILYKTQLERQDIHMVFLNQGETPAQISHWLQSRDLPLRNVLVDELRQASAAFKQQGYPTTLFFDSKGILVSRRIGELSSATLAEKLQQISE